MLKKENYREVLEQQLVWDYSVTKELLQGEKNVFVKLERSPFARKYKDRDSFMKILCYRNKIVIACKDDSMLSYCRQQYESYKGEWFARFDNLRKLDQKLAEYGHKIGDIHHYYIPEKHWEERYAEYEREKPAKDYTFCLLGKHDLLQFKGDDRFSYALSFDEKAEDVLAVAAFEKSESYENIQAGIYRKIKGMAGVSADSDKMWQIGIDVLSSERSKGLAVHLVHSMMKECVERNILPFYGTAESHMNSQAVAVQSGFIPTWWELQTIPLSETW